MTSVAQPYTAMMLAHSSNPLSGTAVLAKLRDWGDLVRKEAEKDTALTVLQLRDVHRRLVQVAGIITQASRHWALT